MPRKDLYSVMDPYPVTPQPRPLAPETPPAAPDLPSTGVGLMAPRTQPVLYAPNPSRYEEAYRAASTLPVARRFPDPQPAFTFGSGPPRLGYEGADFATVRTAAPFRPKALGPGAGPADKNAPRTSVLPALPEGVQPPTPPKHLDLHGIEEDRRRDDRRARLAALLSAVPALAGALAGPTSAFGNAMLGIGNGMATGAQNLYTQNREAYQRRTADAYAWLRDDATQRREDALRRADALLGVRRYEDAVRLYVAGGMDRPTAEALAAGQRDRDKAGDVPTPDERHAETDRAYEEAVEFAASGNRDAAARRYAYARGVTMEVAHAWAFEVELERWRAQDPAHRGPRPQPRAVPPAPSGKGPVPGATPASTP